MRLISSVALLFYFFSPTFSSFLESVPKSQQGETSTSAPSTVSPEKPEWGQGFLPPQANLEASTTSATSNAAPEKSSNDLIQLKRLLSNELKTNSKEENSGSKLEETSIKPHIRTTSKKPHQVHKLRKAVQPQPEQPLPVTVTPLTDQPTRHHPCRCADGVCACCTGAILESLHIPVHRRACVNIEYKPDDFAFRMKIFWNKKLLFDERITGKNPRPTCIPINQYFGVKMCARLSNIYFSGRNMHACLDLEGTWNGETAFHFPFNCFRIGTMGLASLQPEEGGGLPPPPDEEEQVDEDYDDTARSWRSNAHVVNI